MNKTQGRTQRQTHRMREAQEEYEEENEEVDDVQRGVREHLEQKHDTCTKKCFKKLFMKPAHFTYVFKHFELVQVIKKITAIHTNHTIWTKLTMSRESPLCKHDYFILQLVWNSTVLA